MIRHSLVIKALSLVIICMIFSQCGDNAVSVDPGNDDDDTSNPAEEFSHTLAPGASAEAFISNNTHEEIIIEIQYMPGAAPDQESVSNLRSFLTEHLEKSNITLMEPLEISSGGQESYTATDVREIEEENRQQFTEESKLASYILFLDGEYETESVLGIAYYNTSTAYFSETIDRISGGLGQPTRTMIESTVFAHEFGHLMGLVNNGIETQADHHDSENGAHCTVENCLMYYQVETTNFFANLFDGSIPELDEFCLADIEAVNN